MNEWPCEQSQGHFLCGYIVVDTNICISCIRGSNNTEALGDNFILHEDEIKIPAIVVAELMHGAYKSKFLERTLRETIDFISNFEVIEFDYQVAEAYGQIRASLERKGNVIGYYDMLIAATALSRNAVLVTNNTKEFSRIDGLTLTDWTL